MSDRVTTEAPGGVQEETMKAIVQDSYGSADVLELRTLETPVPGPGEVLVRVHASSVNPADWHWMTGRPYFMRAVAGLGTTKRKIPGADLAGRVEGCGEGAARFRPGDDVYGEISGGAYAEYVCVAEDAVATKPHNLGYVEAAAVPLAGLTALQAFDRAALEAGQHVLVNGASGGVGTFAIQIAKALRAEVTGVCSSRNVEMVRSIGADHVVDYTEEDFTAGEVRYDVILDLAGSRPFQAVRRVLGPGSVYIASSDRPGGDWLGPLPWMAGVKIRSIGSGIRLVMFTAKPNVADLDRLRELVEAGEVTPVIDRRIDLSDAAEALRHQEAGHAQGKTVITV